MFKPTEKSIYKLACEVNHEIFNDLISIETLTFRVKNSHKWAMGFYCDFEITVHKNWHKTRKDYKKTLAHELTHYYQDMFWLDLDHGKQGFFRFFQAKIFDLYGE
jgi:hypothetical protein